MPIRFTCKCGRRLKARDEMAGRGTVCPTCHAFVGIPSLRPTHRGTPPPTVADRSREILRRSTRCSDSGDEKSQKVGPKNLVAIHRRNRIVDSTNTTQCAGRLSAKVPNASAVRISLRTRPRWEQFLRDSSSGGRNLRGIDLSLYEAIPRHLRLGGTLALLTSLITVTWPHLWISNREGWAVMLLVFCFPGFLYVLADSVSRIDLVLSRAVNGTVRRCCDVEPQLSGTLLSCARWLGCFLAGPVLLVGSAIGFWISCGELTAIDWLILAELNLAAGAWWASSVVTSHAIVVPPPLTPLRCVPRSMCPRIIGSSLLTAGVFLGHALIALFAILLFHEEKLWGLLVLVLCWSSALHFVEIAMRRMGLAFNRLQLQSPLTGVSDD